MRLKNKLPILTNIQFIPSSFKFIIKESLEIENLLLRISKHIGFEKAKKYHNEIYKEAISQLRFSNSTYIILHLTNRINELDYKKI